MIILGKWLCVHSIFVVHLRCLKRRLKGKYQENLMSFPNPKMYDISQNVWQWANITFQRSVTPGNKKLWEENCPIIWHLLQINFVTLSNLLMREDERKREAKDVHQSPASKAAKRTILLRNVPVILPRVKFHCLRKRISCQFSELSKYQLTRVRIKIWWPWKWFEIDSRALNVLPVHIYKQSTCDFELNHVNPAKSSIPPYSGGNVLTEVTSKKIKMVTFFIFGDFVSLSSVTSGRLLPAFFQ